MYEKVPTLEDLSAVTRRIFPSANEIEKRQAEAVAPLMKLLTMSAERDAVHGWPGERPVTLSAFIGATHRKADAHGGHYPKTWHLPRDCAEELARDCADHFGRMGGFRDNNGQPANPPTASEFLNAMASDDPPLLVAVAVHTTADPRAELRPPSKCTGNTLSATNDPIPHANKRLLMQVYQAHPLLKALLDQARGKKVGEWVTAVDPPHGPDHSAVTVFEKQPDGSLTMVASETDRAAYDRVMERVNAHQIAMDELRPLFQHADKPLHWVQDGDDAPEVAFWETADAPTWTPEGERCMWRLHDETQQYAPDAPQLSGYHYLGPAEWRAHMQAVTPGMWSDETVRADKARIATLEAENTALRTERDYERARLAEWQDAATAGLLPVPRAHDFGVLASGTATLPTLSFTGDGPIRVMQIDGDVTHYRTAPETAMQPISDQPGGLRAMMDDPHPTNPTGEIHEAVERVIGHIADGKVTKTGRAALRGALDKVDTPPTGRAASDAAIGRIARLA